MLLPKKLQGGLGIKQFCFHKEKKTVIISFHKKGLTMSCVPREIQKIK